MIVPRVLGMLSPPGGRSRLSILIFHRVLPQPDPLFPGEIDAAGFDRICRWLARWFNVLPLGEAVNALAEHRLCERALSITFDDGYADNHDQAMPILQRHRLSATFFVAGSFLDGGRMWNDTVIESLRRSRRDRLDLDHLAAGGRPLGCYGLGSIDQRRGAIEAVIDRVKYLPVAERLRVVDAIALAAGASLPRDLMMSSEQVRGLVRGGMDVGAHTMTHPILATLDDAAARQEIGHGRDLLEGLVQKRIGVFAYPNGRPGVDYDRRSVEIVRELGFDAAVSTAWGAAHAGSDRFQLPRFTPWDRTAARFAGRLMGNLWSSRPSGARQPAVV